MSTTQPIRNVAHVRALTNYYLKLGQHRNHLLIVFSLHTALRIGDILPLRYRDVYDFKHKRIRPTLTLKEQKTGKQKTLALNSKIANVLKHSAATSKPYEYLFANPVTGKPICRAQAYRIIKEAGENINLPTQISCHSLRKTFGYHAWKNGVSPAVIMEIFNHSSLHHTRRYLGINQDDLDAAYAVLNF